MLFGYGSQWLEMLNCSKDRSEIFGVSYRFVEETVQWDYGDTQRTASEWAPKQRNTRDQSDKIRQRNNQYPPLAQEINKNRDFPNQYGTVLHRAPLRLQTIDLQFLNLKTFPVNPDHQQRLKNISHNYCWRTKVNQKSLHRDFGTRQPQSQED